MALGLGPGVSARGADGVVLREEARPGQATRISVTLEANGVLRPEPEPGKPGTESKVKVRTQLDYLDRSLPVAGPVTARSARKIEKAEATVEGDESLRPASHGLRPEVGLLVAERSGDRTIVAGATGPLTRQELELVQLPADPLDLPGLLPTAAVAEAGTWPIPDSAARSLTGYERIEANALVGRLEKLEAATARIEIEGEVAGEYLGARGRTNVSATVLMDRSAGRVSDLTLRRGEKRSAGAVEPGLEFQSTLKMTRRPVDPAPAIPGPEVAGLSADAAMPAAWADLLLIAPGDRYAIHHDRTWHLVGEDERQVALRRLERGQAAVQLNLINGPPLPADEKHDAQAFREQVRQALGDRFRRFLDVGEVAGAEAGGKCYRVVVEGDQGGTPIRWVYYRLLGARGEQQVATFTLRSDQAAALGDLDLRLMRSFSWGKSAATR
jgi:hypothetical protein